jgi:type I restriction enzyme S subunit
LLSTASEGVARLRELILTLGLQGKLVAQDPNDERASILIERIGSLQRGRSGRRGRNEIGDADIAEDESPFSLPLGWQWTRLGSIFTLQYGAALPEQNRLPGSIPVYGSNGQVGTHREALVLAPSLVIGRKGSVGAVNVTNGPFWPIDTSYFVTPPDGVHLQYAYWLFRSLRLGKHDKATAIPGISRNDVYAERIALPPYAEQARIVARVDELMRLCDALEEKGRLEAEQHARLLSTLLGTLTDSATPEELAANWQRVAEHFDLLLDRPEAVYALEQVVLQLGTVGLLTEHTASGQTNADTGPFHVPNGWRWTTLGQLCSMVTSGSRSWKDFYSSHGATFIRSQDIKLDRLEFDNRAFVKLPKATEGVRTQVRQLDLLVTITGANVGKAAVLTVELDEAYVSQHVALVRLKEPEMAPFLHLWLVNGHGGRKLLLSSSYGAKPGLSLKDVRDLPVPVPPLTEQRRIVTRVTELRRLCATLRERLQAQQATQSRLAEALVAQATA